MKKKLVVLFAALMMGILFLPGKSVQAVDAGSYIKKVTINVTAPKDGAKPIEEVAVETEPEMKWECATKEMDYENGNVMAHWLELNEKNEILDRYEKVNVFEAGKKYLCAVELWPGDGAAIFGTEDTYGNKVDLSVNGTALKPFTQQQHKDIDIYYDENANHGKMIACQGYTTMFFGENYPNYIIATAIFSCPEKAVAPVVLLKGSPYGKKAVKLNWTKVPGATSYKVYGAICSATKYSKIATVKGTSYIAKKVFKKALKKNRAYKFYVKAYKGSKLLCSSKLAHIITNKTMGRFGNAKGIKVKKTAITLKVGGKANVGASFVMPSGKKHLGTDHGAKIRYISSNKNVATVDAKGNVKGVGDGTAYIYSSDLSGIYVKTKVTVNAKTYTVTCKVHTQYFAKFNRELPDPPGWDEDKWVDASVQTVKDGRFAKEPDYDDILAAAMKISENWYGEGYFYASEVRWYLDEEGTQQWDFATPVTKDITLYGIPYNRVW